MLLRDINGIKKTQYPRMMNFWIRLVHETSIQIQNNYQMFSQLTIAGTPVLATLILSWTVKCQIYRL